MRLLASGIASVVLWAAAAVPTWAQSADGALQRAASALRSNPVYVDEGAERAIDPAAADRLSRRIRERGVAVFLAILPASVTRDVEGDPARLLARRVNLAGTYGVVAGNSFRAASTNLPPGRDSAAATAAFRAHSNDGTEAVLADFVDRVAAEGAAVSGAGGRERREAHGPERDGARGGGGGLVGRLVLLLLLGAGGAGLYVWMRGRRRREEAEERVEISQDPERPRGGADRAG